MPSAKRFFRELDREIERRSVQALDDLEHGLQAAGFSKQVQTRILADEYKRLFPEDFEKGGPFWDDKAEKPYRSYHVRGVFAFSWAWNTWIWPAWLRTMVLLLFAATFVPFMLWMASEVEEQFGSFMAALVGVVCIAIFVRLYMKILNREVRK